MNHHLIHSRLSRTLMRLLVVPLLWLPLPVAIAAEADAAKGISIRLFAVALNQDQRPVCLMTEKARSAAFEIPTLTLSDPQSVSARDFFLIAADSPTDQPPVPLASIQLPDQGSDFRIILIPASGGIYKSVVIRGDDSKFSRGDFFFLNLSDHQMLGLLGAARLDLKPGSRQIIRPTRGETDKGFEVKFARRQQDALLPLTNTMWPVVLDNRSYVIFYNGQGGRPTYRAVDEFIALPSAATFGVP